MEEDSRTEFKRQLTKDSMKTVVAFSNTDGGSLYYGIDDDGNNVGVENPDSVSLSLISMINDTIRPSVTETTDIKHILLDGRDIVRVDVQEGPSKPYYLREKELRPEGVYIRKGPSSIQASEAQITRMIRDGSVSFESSVSFEQNLTFNTASEIFRESGIEFGEAQMKTLGFYSRGLYTILAYLVSDQCDYGVKLAAYSDRYKTEFIDRREIKGSVLMQVQETMRFLAPYNPLSSKIEGVRRTDRRAYPESSLREVLMNAVVHRDYSVNADILVSVFGDGISVSSYGGLMRGLGKEDIMMGISSPRNPKLAALFYRVGYIEAYGTGIPRMFGDYRDSSLKPNIEISTNVFKVDLPKIIDKTGDLDLTDSLLGFIENTDSFSRSDVENLLNVSRTKAMSILSELISLGKVEAIGKGRSVRYRRV